MSSRWWRAYDEAVDDPKLQMLPAPLFKVWFNLMCLASAGGGALPPIEIIAFKLRLTDDKLGAMIEELVTRGLLDEFDGALRPHNWNERQFRSDVTDPTNAERQRRYRHRHATVTDTVTVTPPRVQSTEAETESKKTPEPLRGSPPAEARRPKKVLSKVPFPDEWDPIELIDQEEFERFKNHALANDRRYANWQAAWRNWKTSPFRANGNGKLPPPETPATEPVGFYAEFSSPELDAWNAYGRQVLGLNYPQDKRGGWYFPTQWPPSI